MLPNNDEYYLSFYFILSLDVLIFEIYIHWVATSLSVMHEGGSGAAAGAAGLWTVGRGLLRAAQALQPGR
jgi:hypothetical protein